MDPEFLLHFLFVAFYGVALVYAVVTGLIDIVAPSFKYSPLGRWLFVGCIRLEGAILLAICIYGYFDPTPGLDEQERLIPIVMFGIASLVALIAAPSIADHLLARRRGIDHALNNRFVSLALLAIILGALAALFFVR